MTHYQNVGILHTASVLAKQFPLQEVRGVGENHTTPRLYYPPKATQFLRSDDGKKKKSSKFFKWYWGKSLGEVCKNLDNSALKNISEYCQADSPCWSVFPSREKTLRSSHLENFLCEDPFSSHLWQLTSSQGQNQVLKNVFDLHSPGAFGTLLQVIRRKTSLKNHMANSMKNGAKPSVSSMRLESTFVHVYVHKFLLLKQIHTLSPCKMFTILYYFTFLQPLVRQLTSSAYWSTRKIHDKRKRRFNSSKNNQKYF